MPTKKPKPKSNSSSKKKVVSSTNKRSFFSSRKPMVLTALVFGVVGLYMLVRTFALTTQPLVPPAQICGDTALLSGPATAPTGAIVVPAGDNTDLTPNWNGSGFSQQNKTFWFAPGVHYVGNDQFAQIIPGSGSTYIGAPGAIIDGQNINEKAFTGNASNVTIKYLTIRNFVTPHDQGAVNGDAGSGWNVSYNTMTGNNGAAIFAADNSVTSYNCLKDNGQYGFQTAGGTVKALLDHNEIAGNNAANTEQTAGIENCGCSGGGKFWDSKEVTVTNNYVHDNKGAGLWADTINVGFLIEGNWLENNDGEAVYMEVSYNFNIVNNVFKHNGTVFGPKNPGFPTGAIYISESGSDPRVTTATNNFNQTSEISGNLFENNWGGVALWENSDRFCSNGLPTVECTLVNPSVITVQSCEANLADPTKNQPGSNPDYFNDCRWRTQNVQVHNNTFRHDPAKVGPACTPSNSCGVNAVFSNYGSNDPYTSSKIATNIAFNQNNKFFNNEYVGPWSFMPWAQSNTAYPISFADWKKPVTDKCMLSGQISSGTCNSGFGQDAGSTYNGTAPVTTTDTIAPTSNITAPDPGATISGTFNVTANASDNVGVDHVVFVVDSTEVASDVVAPYSYSWNTATLANGTHRLWVKAYDAAGNVGQSAILSINVNNVITPTPTPTPTADTTAPVVTIAKPVNGSKITTRNLNVTAGAKDNVAVTKMEVYIDGTMKKSWLASSINFSMPAKKLKSGQHTVMVKAYDAAGNVGQATSVVYR